MLMIAQMSPASISTPQEAVVSEVHHCSFLSFYGTGTPPASLPSAPPLADPGQLAATRVTILAESASAAKPAERPAREGSSADLTRSRPSDDCTAMSLLRPCAGANIRRGHLTSQLFASARTPGAATAKLS